MGRGNPPTHPCTSTHSRPPTTQKWGEKDLCTALTDHVPGVWAFQVTEKDKRECVFRVELPSAHDDAVGVGNDQKGLGHRIQGTTT